MPATEHIALLMLTLEVKDVDRECTFVEVMHQSWFSVIGEHLLNLAIIVMPYYSWQ